jgi:hypothetical protein
VKKHSKENPFRSVLRSTLRPWAMNKYMLIGQGDINICIQTKQVFRHCTLQFLL